MRAKTHAVRKRLGGSYRGLVGDGGRSCIGEQIAALRRDLAVVERMGRWIGDLDVVHGRLEFAAVLRSEQPTFLVNAAGAVPHDVAPVLRGIGAAMRQRADPLRLQREAERSV